MNGFKSNKQIHKLMRNKFRIYSKRLLVAFVAFTLFSTAYAQKGMVSGKVTDASTGETLPGATVMVKGTNQGTTTDIDGNYRIDVEPNTTLVFSYVGYKKTERVVEPNTTVNVALQLQAKGLEEVVVIGYGEQKKEDATGSVSTVSSDEFNQGSITSPQELLQGKTAGVQITTGGGAPGEGATIRIRGGSSLSASNAPLIVVDGVPLDGEGVAGMRNPLNTINPEDIKSFSVLKDASATAIYGSRASNGVILIETKKGRKGQDLEVEYSAKASLQTIRKQVDVFGSEEFKSIINERFSDKAQNLLGNANTDWQDEIYENAFHQDHNLSLTGSYKNIPFRAAVGYADKGGILKTSSLNRLTGSLSLNPSFLEDKLKVNMNIKGMQIENTFANRGAIGSSVAYDPTHPVMNNSDFRGYHTWLDQDGNPIPIAPANPVALLELTDDQSKVYRSVGNLKLDYELPFLSDMRTVLNLGYDYADVSEGNYHVPFNAPWSYRSDSLGGIDREYDQTKENELLDFYLKYNKELPSISSKIDFTGGYSWEHHYQKGYTYETNDITEDTTLIFNDTDYETEYYLVSFFGRLNYTFKERYLLTLTIRNDGTSRFAEDNRWGLFPSAAFAWKIHQEAFLENADALSNLKLRLGYGLTGQQNINQGNYPYLPQYTFSEDNARYQFGNGFVTTLRPEGYNENLKWEETATYNIGLDYGFFDQRLNGSIEAYYRETKDLLNTIPVPAGTNFTNRILSNVGNMEIKGIEFTVTGRPIVTEDIFWEISMNADYNQNEITKLTTVDDPDYPGVETGGISGGVGNTIQIHTVGHPRSSFFVYEQVYDENGDPLEGVYVDQNGDGIINAKDKYRYEDPSPDLNLGISSRFTYKEWDFSFSARANIGNYVYNNVSSNNAIFSSMYNSVGYLTNSTTDVLDSRFNNARYHSDYYIKDASFFRFDNITLGYTFEGLWSEQSSLRVHTTAQNPIVITKYEGLDPEVFGGIDNNIYPRPRTFLLGVNVKF